MIALKVRGEIENLSSICINDNLYPLGQVIRGAFGYIFLDMGLKLSETYVKNGRPVLYFRDAFVRHTCGGNVIPTGNKIYVCDKCGLLVAEPTVKDSVIGTHIGIGNDGRDKTNSFYTDAITDRKIFNFEIILNMKNMGGKEAGGKEAGAKEVEHRLSEFLSALKYAQDVGIHFGKRKDKGMGKVRLKNVEMKEINKRDIDMRSDEIASMVKDNGGKMTIHFISDIVSKSGSVYGADILKEVKNAAKFYGLWGVEGGGNGGKDVEPEISIVKRYNDSKSDIVFLDLKADPITRQESMEKNKVSAILRGAKYECLLDNGQGLENIYGNDKYKRWFDTLACAEMLRGIGERTTFGKGSFIIK